MSQRRTPVAERNTSLTSNWPAIRSRKWPKKVGGLFNAFASGGLVAVMVGGRHSIHQMREKSEDVP